MQSFPIDLVVTYVDDQDPVWQKAIQAYNVELNPKRYRNWDTFKFWFRGVEKFMSWVRTVHLVVSNIEQVPSWLDQSKVHVVLHKDIIPEQLLPTFNSTTIEMYLHKIPGLAEHFIYSNDDMFAINKLNVEDFFKDGMPVYQIVHRNAARSTFEMQCKNSFDLAAKLCNYTNTEECLFYFIIHTMTPMLRSANEEIHHEVGSQILRRCTKFREPWNFTQYLFPLYNIMSGKKVFEQLSFRYFSMSNIQHAIDTMLGDNIKMVCLNDSKKLDDVEKTQKNIKEAFLAKFSEKSKFEKQQ